MTATLNTKHELTAAERQLVAGFSGDITYKRLAELKAKFDPLNVFRLNQNIKPSSG